MLGLLSRPKVTGDNGSPVPGYQSVPNLKASGCKEHRRCRVYTHDLRTLSGCYHSGEAVPEYPPGLCVTRPSLHSLKRVRRRVKASCILLVKPAAIDIAYRLAVRDNGLEASRPESDSRSALHAHTLRQSPDSPEHPGVAGGTPLT